MSTDFDVIVIGAGIFGSCTAYHCQKLGLKTLLLEQYELGHKNGSSHGESRITRYAHTEKEYVPLVSDAYQQIFDLEKTRGEKLWKKTGLLWASTGNEIQTISQNLSQYNIEHEVLEGPQIGKRYEQFSFDQNWQGLIDPMGGVIYAKKWLHAFQDEFQNLGGLVKENTCLESYVEEDGHVIVKTNSGSYTSQKIIITVGAWIQKVIPELTFKIEPISVAVCFWKTKEESNSHLLDEDHFPVSIVQEMSLREFHYSLPDTDHPGMMKFCYHAGDPLENFQHPSNQSSRLFELPAAFIKQYMPIIDAEKPAIIDRCKYTVSPDDHYVIGKVPTKSANVLVGGCGSGSGFKVAPGIGRALAELAAGKETTVDVSFFSPERFIN